MKLVYFITNVAPHYRAPLWLKILNEGNFNCHFFFGDSNPNGIRSINFNVIPFSFYLKKFTILKNFWFKNKILIWQKGVINICLSNNPDFVIFLGDFYCVSTWVGAIICRLKNISVGFWGHGFYGNEGLLKEFARRTFYRLANFHILYERRGKALMINKGFKKDNLFIVFNSLDYYLHLSFRMSLLKFEKEDVFPFFNNHLPVVIFIGRLNPVKKLDLLINAINYINKDNVRVNLFFIGDGPEMLFLKELSIDGVRKGYIYFEGACYDEFKISKYLFHADLCVSPGNVGLTGIHSLSLGTPVASHSNFNNQMPEVESIIEGYNGFLFKENDLTNLINRLESWLFDSCDRKIIRKRCFEVIDKYYNPNYQVNVFNSIIRGLDPEL